LPPFWVSELAQIHVNDFLRARSNSTLLELFGSNHNSCWGRAPGTISTARTDFLYWDTLDRRMKM